MRIVHQILHAVVCLARQTVGADKVHLPFNLVQRPVPFAGVEEVDAQTGNDLASVTLFLPVEGKGIEMIATEIEHRINLVLDALAQPTLHVLIDGVEGIPATGGVAGSVFVFSYRAGADLYPGFHGFYTFIYIAYYFRQVVSAPLGKAASFAVFAVVVAVGKTGGVFRIAQVVEVYPVYIVAFHHFANKAHQVFFGLWMSGIQEVFAFVGYADGAFLFGDGLFTEGGYMLAVAQRDGHHPGMALHTALVAFGYGKSQRIVAGVAAHLSGQYGVVGLDG